MQRPDVDLPALARASLQEVELPLERADEAATLVQHVMASDIWKRAQASSQRLVEVPFQEAFPASATEPATLQAGVIDLVFHEEDGWVIVDYKTDVVSEKELPRALDHYRPQVMAYAEAWTRLTGEPVKEQALFFCQTGIYARV
jgi:ATP-dependent helicase/nuclease subunit A